MLVGGNVDGSLISSDTLFRSATAVWHEVVPRGRLQDPAEEEMSSILETPSSK